MSFHRTNRAKYVSINILRYVDAMSLSVVENHKKGTKGLPHLHLSVATKQTGRRNVLLRSTFFLHHVRCEPAALVYELEIVRGIV